MSKITEGLSLNQLFALLMKAAQAGFLQRFSFRGEAVGTEEVKTSLFNALKSASDSGVRFFSDMIGREIVAGTFGDARVEKVTEFFFGRNSMFGRRLATNVKNVLTASEATGRPAEYSAEYAVEVYAALDKMAEELEARVAANSMDFEAALKAGEVRETANGLYGWARSAGLIRRTRSNAQAEALPELSVEGAAEPPTLDIDVAAPTAVELPELSTDEAELVTSIEESSSDSTVS